VILSIRYYFEKKKKSIIYFIIENCFHDVSSQEMENKLDHIIGLSFLLEPQTNFPFSLFPENEIPDWLIKNNNPFLIKKISNAKLHFEFSQDKWEQSRLIVPDHESGVPDLAILGEILIFFGNKFSSIGNVKSSEVLNNFKKTDFNNFYSEVTKDQDRFANIQLKQESIQKCIKNHNVKGIIRVHVVLPSKAKSLSQGEDFIAGVRMVKNILEIDELIVDVDKSNLSAILGEKNANLILNFTSMSNSERGK
jgi:hypothetical protein